MGYLNRLGIYVDAFNESGWHKGSSYWIRHRIFDKNAENKRRAFQDLEQQLQDRLDEIFDVEVPRLDFFEDGFPHCSDFPENVEALAKEAFEANQEAVQNLAREPDTCEFILDVDMPNNQL